jgi:hypothetical protein
MLFHSKPFVRFLGWLLHVLPAMGTTSYGISSSSSEARSSLALAQAIYGVGSAGGIQSGAGYAFHNLDCQTIDGSYVCILNRKRLLMLTAQLARRASLRQERLIAFEPWSVLSMYCLEFGAASKRCAFA